jgi:hypothetical protein
VEDQYQQPEVLLWVHHSVTVGSSARHRFCPLVHSLVQTQRPLPSDWVRQVDAVPQWEALPYSRQGSSSWSPQDRMLMGSVVSSGLQIFWPEVHSLTQGAMQVFDLPQTGLPGVLQSRSDRHSTQRRLPAASQTWGQEQWLLSRHA